MSFASASTIPSSHFDLLNSTAVAFVSTIGPGGEPQVNPVWFDWDGRHLNFAQLGLRQKLRNLRRDSRIAVAIADPANPTHYLELRGSVRIAIDPHRALLHRLVAKYLGLDDIPDDFAEERFAVIVEPSWVTYQ